MARFQVRQLDYSLTLLTGLKIERHIVQGITSLVYQLRQRTQKAPGVINTAYIVRLNATFRLSLCWLALRTRNLTQQPETLRTRLPIVGCFYNLYDARHSLHLCLSLGRFGHCWVKRTPAMAGQLSDHICTVGQLLMFRVLPSRWQPPKRHRLTLKRVVKNC